MANISYTSICVSSSFLGFKEGTSLGLSGLSAPEEDSRTRQCRDQIPPNGNAATADVTGLLTNQDQSVQGLQRVNYTSPASPENLRSLGQKLCLWHPKDFCLGRTSLARELPPMPTRLTVERRVWERCRWSEKQERVPLPSPCLSQKFGVSRSKTLSLASKTLLSGTDEVG